MALESRSSTCAVRLSGAIGQVQLLEDGEIDPLRGKCDTTSSAAAAAAGPTSSGITGSGWSLTRNFRRNSGTKVMLTPSATPAKTSSAAAAMSARRGVPFVNGTSSGTGSAAAEQYPYRGSLGRRFLFLHVKMIDRSSA